MKKAVLLISNIDTLIQKAVDAAARSLMRRSGLEKRALRYAFFAFAAAVQLLRVGLSLSVGKRAFAVNFLLLAFGAYWAASVCQGDAETDEWRAFTVHRWKLFLAAAIFLNMLLCLAVPPVTPVLGIVLYVALLFEAYLVKTPRMVRD